MTPDRTPALQVRGLGFAAGGVSVLSDVDLAVADGEFLGIIGPNGAGKTTLFNLLSGLLRPSSGSIALAGRDITWLPPARAGQARARPDVPDIAAVRRAPRGRERQAGRASRAWAAAGTGGTGQCAGTRRPRRPSEAMDVRRAQRRWRAARPRPCPTATSASSSLPSSWPAAPGVLLLDEPMAGVNSEDVPGLTALIKSLHAAGQDGADGRAPHLGRARPGTARRRAASRHSCSRCGAPERRHGRRDRPGRVPGGAAMTAGEAPGAPAAPAVTRRAGRRPAREHRRIACAAGH